MGAIPLRVVPGLRFREPRYWPGSPPPVDRYSGRFDPVELLRWCASWLSDEDPDFQRAAELLAVALVRGLTKSELQELEGIAARAVSSWQANEAMHRDEGWRGWREMLEREFFSGELVPEGRA
jgi:hypothetical protein